MLSSSTRIIPRISHSNVLLKSTSNYAVVSFIRSEMISCSKADLNDPAQAAVVVSLLDSYATDPMGIFSDKNILILS